MLQEKAAGWKPSVFVFEEEQSYLGKEVPCGVFIETTVYSLSCLPPSLAGT